MTTVRRAVAPTPAAPKSAPEVNRHSPAASPAPVAAKGWAPKQRGAQPVSPLAVTMPANAKSYSPATAKGAAALSNLAYEAPAAVRSKLTAAGYTNVEFVEDPATSTQAFVARRGDSVVVAFRGTSSGKDVVTDLVGGAGLMRQSRFGGQLHDGFLSSYQSIEAKLEAAVARASKGDPKTPILFTGHSLGGALAQIAATDLRERGAQVAGVYTFGQPRVGDRAFCDHYKALGLGAKTFRHINQNDPVPTIPKLMAPSLPGNVIRWLKGEKLDRYKHVGHVVYFDAKRTRTMNPSDAVRREAWKGTSVLATLSGGRLEDLESILRSAPRHFMAEYLADVGAQP